MNRATTAPSASRLKPLYACVAAVLGLSAQSAVAAATHLVTSCEDAGPGSLRAVIGDSGTHSGDTVDFSGLFCSSSVISLTTGAITVPQTDLTIAGSRDITIVGKYDRVFAHAGTGTLNFLDVAMGPATATGYDVFGGCVFSVGSVALYNSLVSGCTAHDNAGGYSAGGAIAAFGEVRLKYSQVLDSSATADFGNTFGGGVFSIGNLTARYSTMARNKAAGYSGLGEGGGVFTLGATNLTHVTISSNSAGWTAGGIFQAGGGSFTMTSSTISGNSTTAGPVGGVSIRTTPTVAIANSTIAFNTAASAFGYGVGLTLSTGTGGSEVNVSAKIQSTLISNNSAGPDDLDFSQIAYGSKNITFDPATQANLIRIPAPGPLPLGTITLSCPNLGPLRDNGGLTQTHSLDSRSIAIDKGSNPNGDSQDQRGLADDSSAYPRVSNGKADIGAYEINQSDTIFTSGAEGC